MKCPIISVIVPVYNVEPYLTRCLDSILVQTFSDFELLLVDDGSSDCCGAICDTYAQKDSRVRVYHQTNAGVSHARNTGLDHARGQYVVFVDSDDYVLPGYLHSLYEDVCGHSGVGLIIQGAHGVNSQGEPLRDFLFPDICLPYQRFDEAFAEYELWFWGFSWGKIYQKAVLDAHHIRFDEGISCREDLLFMLRYLFFCDYLQFRPAMNYIYIYYTHSLSHGKGKDETVIETDGLDRRHGGCRRMPVGRNRRRRIADHICEGCADAVCAERSASGRNQRFLQGRCSGDRLRRVCRCGCEAPDHDG